MRSQTLHAIAALCLLAATACGSNGDDTEPPDTTPSTDSPTIAAPETTELEVDEPAVTASSDDGGASVSVVLSDGDMELADPTSADAGSVKIVAKNEGLDLHNLLIVKGDDPAALPVNEDGAVIEDDLPEGDFIGKIAAVDAGTEESALFDLDSGSYILFCNIVQATFPPRSHFQDMVTTLTVT